MQPSANACVDFYQYSCGGWIKHNPIPADQSSWSVYGKMHEENQRFLWGILASLAATRAPLNPGQKQLGDYFAACMNETRVQTLGSTPLRADLEAIAAMRSKQELPLVLGTLHLPNEGGGLFFSLSSSQDLGDSSQVIAFADAGGLGMPDRDYYTNEDAASIKLRDQYLKHVIRMFELLGDSSDAASANATTVLRIETALAKASLTQVERRDPHKLFNKVDARGLRTLTPGFDWGIYLQRLGLQGLNTFNVAEPRFYRALDAQWTDDSLDDIKTYLRWHVAHQRAPYLSSTFVDENFDFFGRTLRGVPNQKPRWKRCVTLSDDQLGDALGKEFVVRTFGAKLKDDTMQMTRQIEKAMEDDILQLSWLTPETKRYALQKLHGIANKIGYPDKWRDYSSIPISRDDFAGNVTRAGSFETKRQLAKIGRPVDRSEWDMSPPTVDAYYNEQMNDINFPAGVLQPPLYDPRMDAAPNYGNTGSTIGHELTHAFDDQGRQYDARGSLHDWWTSSDARAFDRRAQCVVRQYAGYTVVDGIKINSKLTEGEDIADLGGLVLALMAWKYETANLPTITRDGFTPAQRFFIGFAQWACESRRPQESRVRTLTDPHSPGRYRINGVVTNMPEFSTAFSCKVGQPMFKEKPCRVW